MTGQALIVQGNGRRLPLPDASIDLVCTSPPYLWKRKYAIEGDGEMGNEVNWRLYLDGLFAATDEMLRVLKPTGSIFVNLGDTRVAGREAKWLGIPPKSRLLLPERYRVGCQDRYASRGVIVRQVQLWEKANGLPESVTDRTRDTHEDWVHIVKRPNYYAAMDEIRMPYEPDYARRKLLYGENDRVSKYKGTTEHKRQDADRLGSMGFGGAELNPLGALPGSVWKIASEPLQLPQWLGVDHYAAFASEWPRRLVLAFSPPGICLDCDQGRVPVVEREEFEPNTWPIRGDGVHHRSKEPGKANSHGAGSATILGYACSCNEPIATPLGNGHGEDPTLREGKAGFKRPRAPDAGTRVITRWDQRHHAAQIRASGRRREMEADLGRPLDHYMKPSASSGRPLPPDVLARWLEWGWLQPAPPFVLPPTRPAVVLDCFGGTGTTAMVAKALGRIGVSVDLSHAYGRAARWRVKHDGAKAISRTNLERQGVLL